MTFAMLARCTNPDNPDWPNYGGRGITVCDRWRNSFEAFLADMGKKPTPKHSIDRWPDNNGNYEKSNCRWATDDQQARNQRSNRNLTLDGETKCLTDWAASCGMDVATLHCRLDSGMSLTEALAKPVKDCGRQRAAN